MFLGHFLLFSFSQWRGEDDFTKRALQRKPKSIDNAIFAFSIDSRCRFGKLTYNSVLEEVISSNLWQFLHLSLRTNNNVVQQLEMIYESPFYAEGEYEALSKEEEHKEPEPVYTEESPVRMNMRTLRVHFNIELNVF